MNNKFQNIGKAYNGISKATGKPYIRLDVDKESLWKIKPHDLDKIYLFPITQTNMFSDAAYTISAIILPDIKETEIEPITEEPYQNGLGEPLPWEDEKKDES